MYVKDDSKLAKALGLTPIAGFSIANPDALRKSILSLKHEGREFAALGTDGRLRLDDDLLRSVYDQLQRLDIRLKRRPWWKKLLGKSV